MSHGGNPVGNPFALVWILIKGAIDAVGDAIVPFALLAVAVVVWWTY